MKDNDSRAAEELFPSGHQPPSDYQRPPQYDRIVCDKDVAVPMRDGVTVVVDVYRPDAAGQISGAVRLRRSFQGAAGQRASEKFSAAAFMVDRSGSATRRRATPSSSYRAAMSM